MADVSSQLKTGIVVARDTSYEGGFWNALIARRSDDAKVRWVPAHEGDFFPESVSDYVERLRRSVLAGDTRLERGLFPVRIDIDLTQFCNAACTFCFSAPYRAKDSTSPQICKRDLDHWLKDLASSGATKTVRLCGGGEPFSHPEIDQILPLAHKYGFLQTVITNFDLVNQSRCAAIFDHVDHLRWSVDAATDELRAAIHRPSPGANSLHRSVELISALIQRRKRERPGKRRPEVWATYMLLPESVPEIPQFTELMRSIGVDTVSFRPVLTGHIPRWDSVTKARLYKALDHAKRLHSPPDFCVFIPKRGLDDAAQLNPSDYFKHCLSRRLRTVVEASPDGPVFQACGVYRGTGLSPYHGVSPHESICDTWARVSERRIPLNAPTECIRCIDVSINRTLTFIFGVLTEDPHAQFECAYIPQRRAGRQNEKAASLDVDCSLNEQRSRNDFEMSMFSELNWNDSKKKFEEDRKYWGEPRSSDDS